MLGGPAVFTPKVAEVLVADKPVVASVTVTVYTPASAAATGLIVSVAVVAPLISPPLLRAVPPLFH